MRAGEKRAAEKSQETVALGWKRLQQWSGQYIAFDVAVQCLSISFIVQSSIFSLEYS